jgi:hypothetical protein
VNVKSRASGLGGVHPYHGADILEYALFVAYLTFVFSIFMRHVH